MTRKAMASIAVLLLSLTILFSLRIQFTISSQADIRSDSVI
jgi:hypothetical protein